MRPPVTLVLAACSVCLACDSPVRSSDGRIISNSEKEELLHVWNLGEDQIRGFLADKHNLRRINQFLKAYPKTQESSQLIQQLEEHSFFLVCDTLQPLPDFAETAELYDGHDNIRLNVLLARVGDKSRIDSLLQVMRDAYVGGDRETVLLVEDYLQTFRFGDTAEYWMQRWPQGETVAGASVKYWTEKWGNVRERAAFHRGCWYPHGERTVGLGGGDCDECKRVLELKSPAAK